MKNSERNDNSGSMDRDQSINDSTQQHSQGSGNPGSSRTQQSGSGESGISQGSSGASTGSHSREDVDTDGGAPSRQTSNAGNKSGQL